MINGTAKIASKTTPIIFCQLFNGKPKTNIPVKETQPRIIKISTKLILLQTISLLLLIDLGIKFFIFYTSIYLK